MVNFTKLTVFFFYCLCATFRTVGEAALGTDVTLGIGIIGITTVVVQIVVGVVATGLTDGDRVLVIVVGAAQGPMIDIDAVNNFAKTSTNIAIKFADGYVTFFSILILQVYFEVN